MPVTATSPPAAALSSGRIRFLAAVFAVNLLAFLNVSAMFVAMADIGKALGTPEALVPLLPTSLYAAVVCVAPATPFLLARLGPRRLLLLAIAGTSATTALAFVTPGFWGLVAALFAHGLFCAPIVPATQAVTGQRFAGEARGVAMAVWGAGSYASWLVGPLLAGVMVGVFGWRSLFLIPLPFAALSVLLVLWGMERGAIARKAADLASLGLAPLVMVLLVATTSLGPGLGWLDSPTVTACAIALAIAAPLYVWRYRKTVAPAFHVGCLADRNVAFALLIILLFNFFGTGFFQIEFLGKETHLSAEVFGLRSSIGAATLLLGFAVSGWLTRGARFAACLYGGLAVTLVSKVGFLLYGTHTDALEAIWPVAVGGVGFGMVTGVLATLAYRTVAAEHASHVATAFILATYLGASLGAGVLDEVLVAADLVDLAEGMSAAAATLSSFEAEFWVELFGTALLLLPAALMLRGKPATC